MRVVNLATELEADAVRCADARAYYAACLIGACALEAMLLANVLAFEPEMQTAGTWPKSKRPPESWSLAELLRFHRDLGWLSTDESVPFDLGQGIEIVNWIRNVVAHPGKLIREAHEFEVDEKAAQAIYATLQALFEETNKLYQSSS
jgi:hypothetical protein